MNDSLTSLHMRISIALCTYNGERFLSDQLESFLAQTRLPDELVVCDDASSDSTLKILEDFATKAPFKVRIFRNNKNLGSTLNFEKAIELCIADIIFLSDQDDIWLPKKIETIELEFIKSRSVGMVFSNAELIDENSRPLRKKLWDFYFPPRKRKKANKEGLFRLLLEANVVTGATMAFRANFREAFLPIPKDLPNVIHDGWIAMCSCILAEVKFIEEALVKYRIHQGQQIGVADLRQKTTKIGYRKADFKTAIGFLEKDISRLKTLEDTLRRYPKLELSSDIRSLIEILIAEKKENILHLENRLKLPNERVHRIVPIFQELLNGRYSKFSRGLLSAGKDFFTKPRY